MRPFETDTPGLIAQLIKRTKDAPESPRQFAPELSPAWERVILKCLDYEPAKRFPSAEAVVLALSNSPTFVNDSHVSTPSIGTQIEKTRSAERAYDAPQDLLTGEGIVDSFHREAASPCQSKWGKILELQGLWRARLAEPALWVIAILTFAVAVTALGYLSWHGWTK